MPENEEIEIRSDEVQEILSSVPNWMIRWGITLIFIIIILFIALSYFIKYPDVISGTVSLTTVTPPNRLVTKTSGELEVLFIPDKTEVKTGEVIAQIKNLVSKEEIDYLTKKITEVEQGLGTEFSTPITFNNAEMVFGAIQNDYNALANAVSQYQLNLNVDQYTKRRAILQRQIKNYQRLASISNQQLVYMQDNFDKAEEQYQNSKTLYEENVISKTSFYQQELAFNQVKNEIENLKKSNVQNQITLTDYERQLNELEFEFLNQKTSLTKTIEISLANIRNQILNWEETYEIQSTTNGKLTYLMPLSEHQFIEAGVPLFAVIPSDNQNYVGHMTVDRLGYGKIEIGQDVKIKFDNFPSNEYGQIIGTVKRVSLIPNEQQYNVEVALTNGLESTYHRKLTYTPEMTGQADIITEDLRILERIFNQFRQLFDD